MLSLAEMIEKATEGQQEALLVEAFEAMHGPKPERVHGGSEELTAWLGLFNPFYAMLKACAYESAAMSLVPEGCQGAFDPRFMDDDGVVRFKGFCFKPDWSRWTPHGDWIATLAESELAATPALALCAAALKARSQSEGEICDE